MLNRSGQQTLIQRIVVLSHPRAELGSHANPTAKVATDMDFVLRLVNESQTRLSPTDLTDIRKLVSSSVDAGAIT